MGCAPSAIADGEEEEERGRSPEADELTRKQSTERIRSSSSGNHSVNITSPSSRNGSAKHVPLLNNALDHRNSLGPDVGLFGQRSVGSLKGSAGSTRSGRTKHRLSSDDGVPIPGSVTRTDYLHDMNQQPLTAIEQEMSATNGMGKPVSSKELSINSLVSSPAHNTSNKIHDGEEQTSLDNVEHHNTGNPTMLPNYVVQNESFQRNLNTGEHNGNDFTHNEQDFDLENQKNANTDENTEVALENRAFEHNLNEIENIPLIGNDHESLANTTKEEKESTEKEERTTRPEHSPDMSEMTDPRLTQRTAVSKGSLRGSLEDSPKHGMVSQDNVTASNSDVKGGPVQKHDQMGNMTTMGFAANTTETTPTAHQPFPTDSALERPTEMRLDENHDDTLIREQEIVLPLSSETVIQASYSNLSPPSEDTTTNLNDLSKLVHATDVVSATKGTPERSADSENHLELTEVIPSHAASSADAASGLGAAAAGVSPSAAQSQFSLGFSDAPSAAPAADHFSSGESRSPTQHTHHEPLEASFTCFPSKPNDDLEEITAVPKLNNDCSTHDGRPCDSQGSAHTRKTPSLLTSHRPASSAAVSISDLLSDSDELDASLSTSAAAMLAFPNRSSTAKYRRAHALDRGFGDHASPDYGKSPVEMTQEMASGVDSGVMPAGGSRDTTDGNERGTNDGENEVGDGKETADKEGITVQNEEVKTCQENSLTVDDCDVADAKNVCMSSATDGEEPQGYPRELSADSGFHNQTFHQAKSLQTPGFGTESGAGPSGENITSFSGEVSSNVHESNNFEEENEEIERAAMKGIEDRNDDKCSVADPQIAEKHFSDMLATDEDMFHRLPSMQAVNEYFVNQKERSDDPDFKVQEGAAADDFFSPNSGKSNSYELGQSFVCSDSGAPHSLEGDTTDPTLYLAHEDSLPSSLEAHYPCSKIDLVSETSGSFSGEEGLPHEDMKTDIDFDICHETIFEQYTDEESEAASSKWLFKLNFDSCTEPSLRESSNDATPRDIPPKNMTGLLGREEHTGGGEVTEMTKSENAFGEALPTDAGLLNTDTRAKIEEISSLSSKERDPNSFNRNAPTEQLQQSDVDNAAGGGPLEGSVQNVNESNETNEFGDFEKYESTGAVSEKTTEVPDLREAQGKNDEVCESMGLNIVDETNNTDLFDGGDHQSTELSAVMGISGYVRLDPTEETLKTSFSPQVDRGVDNLIANEEPEKTGQVSELMEPTKVLRDNSTEEAQISDSGKLSDLKEVLNSAEEFAPTEKVNFGEGQRPTGARDAAEPDVLGESSSSVGVLNFAEVSELNEVQEPPPVVNSNVVEPVHEIRVLQSNREPESFDVQSLNRKSNDANEFSNANELKNTENLNEIEELALAQEVYEVLEAADSLDTVSVAGFITVKRVVRPQEARSALGDKEPLAPMDSIDGSDETKIEEFHENLPAETTTEASPMSKFSNVDDFCPSDSLTGEIRHSPTLTGEIHHSPTLTGEIRDSPAGSVSVNEEAQTNGGAGSNLGTIRNESPSNETSSENIISISALETPPPPQHAADFSFETPSENDALENVNENLCSNEDDPQENINETSLADYIENNTDQSYTDLSDPAIINDDITDQAFQNGISSPILAAGEDLIRNAGTESDRVSIKNQINSLIAQEYRSRSNSPVTGLSNSRSNSPTAYIPNPASNSSAANFPNNIPNLPANRVQKVLSNSSIPRFPNSRSNSPAISYISNSSASRLFRTTSRHSSPSLLLPNKSDSLMHAPLGSVS